MHSERLKRIKLIVLDVDGTMTDGGIYIFEDGRQAKKFNAKDGMGIMMAKKAGYHFGIISHSHIVGMIEARAKHIGIEHLYVGREPKMNILSDWCSDMNITLEEVAYLGDDLNDMEVMQAVGVAACPADSVKSIRNISHIVLEAKGGQGAVREFLDNYLLD